MKDKPLQIQIGLQIMRLRRIANVELNARLAPLNASAAMYAVLMRLANEPDAPQSELAFDAALDPAGVSRLVNRMVKDGLMRVAEDPKDRRARRVSLTAKGRKLERSLMPVVDDALRRALGGVNEDEMRIMLDLLERTHALEGTPDSESA